MIQPYEHGQVPLPPMKPVAWFDDGRTTLYLPDRACLFWIFDMARPKTKPPLPANGELDFY